MRSPWKSSFLWMHRHTYAHIFLTQVPETCARALPHADCKHELVLQKMHRGTNKPTHDCRHSVLHETNQKPSLATSARVLRIILIEHQCSLSDTSLHAAPGFEVKFCFPHCGLGKTKCTDISDSVLDHSEDDHLRFCAVLLLCCIVGWDFCFPLDNNQSRPSFSEDPCSFSSVVELSGKAMTLPSALPFHPGSSVKSLNIHQTPL